MLKDKINEDFKNAFKEKREGELSVLKMLKAAILNKEKDKEFQANKTGKDIVTAAITEEDILDVITSEIKKLRDSLAMFEKGGRADLASQAKNEIEILLRYLPQQLTEDEIKKMVSEAIAQAGAQTIKDMGKVMGILAPQIKGKADNGLVGKIVKEVLG
jgi:uncharacterized protein YqeY